MSETVAKVLAQIVEMGFSEEQAQTALAATQWKGAEAALQWLLDHPDGAPASSVANEDDDFADLDNPVPADTEQKPKKVLTEEEKAEKLKKLEELRVVKRREREEREKKELQERERKRVADGKAMSEVRDKLAEQEMKKIAEERRREKMEMQAAKERVRAQIEADKQARKQRELERKGLAQQQPPATQAKPASTPARPAPSYDETRLQMRLPDGSALVQTFKAKEPLAAVRVYIQLNRRDAPGEMPAKLLTSFPRKVYENEEDYDKPLEVLGLTPSAVLIVSK